MTEAEEPAGEALGHLQTAALELIAAARASLEALEKVVADPRVLGPLLETASGVGRAAAQAARSYAARTAPTREAGEEPGPPGRGTARGVEHIRVS